MLTVEMRDGNPVWAVTARDHDEVNGTVMSIAKSPSFFTMAGYEAIA